MYRRRRGVACGCGCGGSGEEDVEILMAGSEGMVVVDVRGAEDIFAGVRGALARRGRGRRLGGAGQRAADIVVVFMGFAVGELAISR